MNSDVVGMDLGGELSSRLGVAAEKRHISPFAMGLLGTRDVESMPAMAKAAAQSGTRNGGKLTQAQLDARAQQRTEDDELIREAQKGQRTAFDALVRRYDQPGLRLALSMLGQRQDAQDVHH